MYLLLCVFLLGIVGIIHLLLQNKISQNLSYAGFHKKQQYWAFEALSFILALVGLFVFFIQLSNIKPYTVVPAKSYFYMLIPFIILVIAPFYILNKKMKEYQASLRKEATTIIDFLIIYLSAGYTIDQTLQFLIIVLHRYQFKFANELEITYHDLQYLGNRGQAWEQLIKRLGERDWILFIRLIQNEAFLNKKVINSLESFSRSLTQERMADLEIYASKASNLSLLVIYFCFLPAFFGMLIIPMVYHVYVILANLGK